MEKKNNKKNVKGGDEINIQIGDNASQVAAGKDVHQTIRTQSHIEVTEADFEAARELFKSLREEIETQVPPEKKEAALQRATELEEAITGEKPDLTTIDYVKSWFGKNIPQLAGTIANILINPIITKLVGAAGDVTVEQLKRILGI